MLGDGIQIFGFGGAQNCCWNLRPPWPARWKLDPGEEGRKSSDLIQYHSTTQRDPPSSPLIRLIPHTTAVSDLLRLTTLKICDSATTSYSQRGLPLPFLIIQLVTGRVRVTYVFSVRVTFKTFVFYNAAHSRQNKARSKQEIISPPFSMDIQSPKSWISYMIWITTLWNYGRAGTIKGNNDRRDSEKCKCNHEWCFGQKSGLRWKIVDPINVKGQKANCMWQLL